MMPIKLLFVVNHSEFFLSHRLPIAQFAMEQGYEVHLATSKTPALAQVRRHGIITHTLPLQPGGMNPFKDFALLLSLFVLYRKIRPDIIHQVTIKPVMYGSIAARLSKTMAVINAMSGMGYLYISNSFKQRILRKIIQAFLKFGFKHPNIKMILQNLDDQKLFVESAILNVDDIQLIKGSGVDPKLYSPQAEPAKPFMVLMPARLLWDKGVGEFVEAAQLVKKTLPETRFVLVGDIDENNPKVVNRSQILDWVKLGHVEWLGMRDDMPAILNQAQIVCLPSYREGLPKSLIEAASCGRPIVSTDVPGCREIARDNDNALLVPPRNGKALAAAIEKLLKDPVLCKKMGVSGRSIVLNEFTLDHVLKQTFTLYQTMTNNSRRLFQ
ncbi:glycosyltransferase family 4 protein [Akkermansiaceae bacterium]|nr:glycosyltransferase family 4 protein [Akkermansiaceae bacterium]